MSQSTARFLFLVAMISLALILAGCDTHPANGMNGVDGSNGYTTLLSILPADYSICPNGGSVLTSGPDTDGTGILKMREIKSTAIICNGVDGINGTNGVDGQDGTNGADAPPTALTPVAILAPCALSPMHPTATELSNPDLEVFVQLQNGTILTSFSETIAGYNTHFGVLSPGHYMSTGATNCTFTVSATGVISR